MLNKVVKEYFRTLHHKKSVRAITAATIMLGLPVIGAYSYLFAVKRIELDYVPIKIKGLKGLKICQISDLHYGPTNKDKAHFNKAIDLINDQAPDLVMLTGDYYQWDPDYLYDLPALLGRIRAKTGVYACLGNHDYGSCYPGEHRNDPFEFEVIKAAFERNDIQVLTNDSLILNHGEQEYNLVGLHDLWSKRFHPDEAFDGVDQTLPTLVLSHNPDSVKVIEHNFDLMFSGHCHGGQVTWPFVGSLTVPVKHKKYNRGLHRITDRKNLYINRGLGHTFRMRLNSTPEVTLIEIV